MPIPDRLDTAPFREAWSGWIADRKARKKPLTAYAARLHLRELEKLESPDEAIACIELAVNRTWQGIKAEWYRNAVNGAAGNSASSRAPAYSNTDRAKQRRADQRRREFAEPDVPLPDPLADE